MAACNFLLSLVLVLASFSTGYVFAETNKVSFTIDIIHRDSLKSPFYNPLETSSQRVADAFLRSRNRVDHIGAAAAATSLSSSSTPQSLIIEGNGDYLMTYSIGTPPLQILGVIDTGSDIIWLQCKPCENCYNQTIPMFDPSHSTTYANVSCSSSQCKSVTPGGSCSAGGKEACKYYIQYGDLSSSEGDVAMETLTLGSSNGQPTSFPNTVIGCGHSNTGEYDEKSSGIVGFGYSKASLVSQLNSSIDGKFSYCLVPSTDQASKLSFGENADSNSTNTVITPLTLNLEDPFYHLTMEAISVGERTIRFSQSTISNASEEGNIIIDSGTTITYIPTRVYTELEASLEEEIKLERAKDPNGLFSLCFKSAESDSTDGIPIITAHFRDADVKLQPQNTFLAVSDQVICFAFAPNDGISIFGNVAQMDFLVAYDIQKKTVSFTPKDCTHY